LLISRNFRSFCAPDRRSCFEPELFPESQRPRNRYMEHCEFAPLPQRDQAPQSPAAGPSYRCAKSALTRSNTLTGMDHDRLLRPCLCPFDASRAAAFDYPFRRLGNGDQPPLEHDAVETAGDCAESLKRAALPSSRRTSAVVLSQPGGPFQLENPLTSL
jgi:hypothetical protein